MARIVLTTVGIRGDLNPFLGLGCGLRARGHDVVFAVEPTLRDAVRHEGFEARPLAGNVLASLAPHMRTIVGGRTPLAAAKPIIQDWLAADVQSKVKDLESACAGADLIVARAGQLSAPIAAEHLGLPWVQVTMTAMTVPSAHADPGLLRMILGGRLRGAQWAAMELFARRLADPPVNRARRDLGLPAVRNVMGRGGHSPYLTAIAVSPAVSPPRADWPPHVLNTGYCFWDVPSGWRPPVELTRFLDEPGPVVAVSFGSMAPYVGDALAHLYQAAIAGIRAAGARALVVGFEVSPSESVLSIAYAPFSRIYPRCAAVIHHGGPYTVGEALRAGVPSLAVPWGIDQFFTADELVRTGAGRATHHKRFNAARACRDVEKMLNDVSLGQQAAAMAKRLAAEDGVACLCGEVERVLGRSAGTH
jgi:UDP:flavonoid glycosyltransferase YjiC (YdhE family)